VGQAGVLVRRLRLNRHLSNTSEIGLASHNTPYIPSAKGRELYGAFSVRHSSRRNRTMTQREGRPGNRPPFKLRESGLSWDRH
jgi:hypothetical protein